ncbi:MAG: magnesium transporter [Phycisphaerae bacterium SM23_33]|jgi:magnesium transporter|nr:MAG: magnesium transporter [Phycisphaerae bacterium SM23_33]
MPRLLRKGSQTLGQPPGTMVFVGERKTEKSKITTIDYDDTHFEAKQVGQVEECFPYRDKPTVTWINVDGIHDLEVVERLGSHFGIHPLVLEGIVNTTQRPKTEDFDEYIYLVLKMLSYDESSAGILAEQVSVVLGPNFVISFQEREGDVFESIRERLRSQKGRIRQTGADYLLYSMVDAIVDQYFVILEKFGETIETTEEGLISDPVPERLQAIRSLKQDMIFLRKSVWPLREAVSALERAESKLIKKGTRVYLRDVYDHTIQVIDAIETYRDMLSGMLDVYLSSVSNRMNEVMKVLTIIATIFIPLTFVAGIYGMNFSPEASPFNMPELRWRYGYLACLGVMALVTATMVMYFRRKRWF